MNRSISQLNLIFDRLKDELYKNRLVLFKNIDDTNLYLKEITLLQKDLGQKLLSNQINNRDVKNILQERIKPIINILNDINPDQIINNYHDYRYILDTLIEDISSEEISHPTL